MKDFPGRVAKDRHAAKDGVDAERLWSASAPRWSRFRAPRTRPLPGLIGCNARLVCPAHRGEVPAEDRVGAIVASWQKARFRTCRSSSSDLRRSVAAAGYVLRIRIHRRCVFGLARRHGGDDARKHRDRGGSHQMASKPLMHRHVIFICVGYSPMASDWRAACARGGTVLPATQGQAAQSPMAKMFGSRAVRSIGNTTSWSA